MAYFWASWVPQCQQMDEVLTELAKIADSSKIVILKVHAENAPDISKKYNIQSVPVFIFIKNGKELERLEGADAPGLTKKIRCISSQAKMDVPREQPVQDIDAKIKRLIDGAPIMLFMKGNSVNPRCGFSKKALEILSRHSYKFATYDVLSDNDIREGLKAYSQWPTYPQLYVKGNFVGGVDIMAELDEAGELENELAKSKAGGQSLEDKLKGLINQSPVMVFMKGSPNQPRCGFSKTLVALLQEVGVPYGHFDILQDEVVRQGLKTYSDWPTYPQVYVNGSLIGGLDIIKLAALIGLIAMLPIGHVTSVSLVPGKLL
ncbi:GLRX3 [Cordylochernes scorpioides]|uniref:GLRX3 n=1 Tax=Cordylochernes scorpioides TaxID=51811 RepID=A0ABY6K266_9ARAC|nr:GLRX3 [Cordylochernes scorpioides]